MPVISDLALYEVTVRRIDQSTGQEWTYPRLVSHASSVRGALTDALIAPPRPVARAQRRGDRMNPTKRGQQLAASAERWADTAESRAQIAYTEGAGPVLITALAALVSVAYAAASLAWTWTDDS